MIKPAWGDRDGKRLKRSSPRRADERDNGGKVNTKAYEDTEGWGEREEEGEEETAEEGQRTAAVGNGGEGMCSLNRASPRAETERNTSLSRGGG